MQYMRMLDEVFESERRVVIRREIDRRAFHARNRIIPHLAEENVNRLIVLQELVADEKRALHPGRHHQEHAEGNRKRKPATRHDLADVR